MRLSSFADLLRIFAKQRRLITEDGTTFFADDGLLKQLERPTQHDVGV